MALILVLLALLLVSAIGMGMIYMSTTETSINNNYKDTQVAFFAMRGGLEEMRDRMRSDSLQPVPALAVPLIPTSWPGSAAPANSIVYITNPSLGENVDPKTFGNAFFDDEFCHEQFIGLPYVAAGTPCTAANAPPATNVAPYVASMSPNSGTLGSLKYKWARITMKQNGAFQIAPPATPGLVDPGQPPASPVCWDAFAYQERVASAMGGSADCATAVANGFNVQPIYLITSMAVTPSGSRRVGQYEVAAFNIAPPASGLALDGPPAAANFNPPNSNNGEVNGNDGSYPTKPGSGYASAPAVAGCNANSGAHAAIGVDDTAAQAIVTAQISKPNNYLGLYTTPPAVPPSVVPLPLLTSNNWSNPTQLNNLASEMANVADVTCPGSTLCSGPTYGTVASPQITYANGDFTLGNGNNGAGVLVVTGNLTISGKMEYDGLILVIGQGSVTISGGGDGTIFGEMFVANTNGAVGGVLGTPNFIWNGGGSAGIYYNSCWAAVGNNLHYMVVASREEMY